MLINAVRGYLGEYGITAAKGAAGVRTVLKAIYIEQDQLPLSRARECRGMRVLPEIFLSIQSYNSLNY